MRLSSLFTLQTAVSSALLAITLFPSSASAQDRTTEQGEAQITGEHFIVIPAHELPVFANTVWICSAGAYSTIVTLVQSGARGSSSSSLG